MTSVSPRPTDATLSVTKAARMLGVHPNTIRAWSDAGRLRYYRINPRGDRRYRLGDLQRFLAAAAGGPVEAGTGAAHVGGRRGVDGRGTPSRQPVLAILPGVDEAHDRERRERDLQLLTELATVAGRAGTDVGGGVDEVLTAAVEAIHDTYDHHLVGVWEVHSDSLLPRAVAGPLTVRLVELPRSFGTPGAALASAEGRSFEPDPVAPVGGGNRPEIAAVIPGERGPWGVLVVVGAGKGALTETDGDVVVAAAEAVAAAVRAARAADEISHQLHRADALRRVAGDIGTRLDLDQILAGLVEHAMVLFEADRAGVFLRNRDGKAVAEVSRGLSAAYLNAVREFPAKSLPTAAVAARRPLFATNYRDDPRGVAVRAAVVQEGFDTICTAPLLDGEGTLGLLNVYHDRPHEWTEDELDTMAALAMQASVAINTARNYAQMATWAAQLQSIQQLGTKLNGLTSVEEIGFAIATELRQLIDSHNVRVYRLYGDDLVPVAMKGQVGEYVDETPEMLHLKLGEGITGWVAQHRVPQNLQDSAKDPRANTIPGTQPDLDESLLLAPMIFEDQVLGVLVLAKLGLNQFTDDDLRLLVIYASFAAQAMAIADTTQRLREQSATLERQLRSQRELLQITESILTTLDPRAVLDQIADRLGELVGYDNISIEVFDRAARTLRPLTARGLNADEYLKEWEIGEQGIATWAIEHNEPVLIVDQFEDVRVRHFEAIGPQHGGLIVVPLRGREGVTGVLTLERLGPRHTFSEEEFELVKLFAAQVSIALQNAEVYRDVEIRARTDGLTGLLNHSTFRERLAASVSVGESFSLVMLDLDDFKAVNDAMGHQAGDRLLSEIARAIVAAGRETDHVFRYGGDEFALILPGADAVSAVAVAERVRSAIQAVGGKGTTWHADGIKCSASLGLATYPVDGATVDSILLAADRACFVAKRSGPGLIATADEGMALAAEFSLQEPTPVDPPTPTTSAA